MNISRGTSLLLAAFVFEFHDLRVLEVIGNVSLAIVRAGIDAQDFFGRRGSGKIGEELVRAGEPRTDGKIAADVSKGILECVGVPEAYAGLRV